MRSPLHRRVAGHFTEPENWKQFVRFATVGSSSYIINLIVFWLVLGAAGNNHRIAATAAFLVAVSNSFLWNRIWTFDAQAGHAGFQAVRFLTVSVAAWSVSLAVLEVLITAVGIPPLISQAIAAGVATPVNFFGNRCWTFRMKDEEALASTTIISAQASDPSTSSRDITSVGTGSEM